MKFEERENTFVFVIAPRYPKEHRFASNFPDFASFFARGWHYDLFSSECFHRKYHSTSDLYVHFTVSRMTKPSRRSLETLKQSSALQISWSIGLKGTVTF
jgi:hypothetical protein